ncbi:MAG TPA: cupin domain-containing protein [Nitrolancea sp.]|nr:cupin domain-containing protein [Nitrolancea sp.]
MTSNLVTSPGCSYIAPDAGERFNIFDDGIAVKVDGAETDGAYAVVTITTAPGGGPPLHAHPGSETFFVLSGEFAFTQRDADGASTFRAASGAVVHAPGGTPHRFENVSATPSTLLIVLEPEALDFLREAGAIFSPGAEPEMETMLALTTRYQMETFYDGEGARPEPTRDGATSAEARALAWRFAHANDALIEVVERTTPEQWGAICADTGWTVAVQAHHIAVNHAQLAGMIGQIAEGQPPAPVPVELIDAANARHAAAFANVTQSETVALLRHNGALAAEIYRGLSDDQLARTAVTLAGAPPSTVTGLIRYLAVGEIERHGQAIREAIA